MRRAAAALLMLLAPAGCKRESAPVTTGRPPSGVAVPVVRTSDLVAGPSRPTVPLRNPYEGDKNAIADGERYFNWFNCTGCHGARGGGGIGPPLADDDWIYGGEPAQIFQTIMQGRPGGMPSFGGQIPDDQVWKIAAYVRTLPELAGGKAEGVRGGDAR